MSSRRLMMLGLTGLQLLVLSGCQTLGRDRDPQAASQRLDDYSLTAIVAELHMHLRDDTYRLFRRRDRSGQSVFDAALWRLDRMRQSRERGHAPWADVDSVIEFARARALERVRRYAEAAASYEKVAAREAGLEREAAAAAQVMRSFSDLSGPVTPEADEGASRPQAIEARVEAWISLAAAHAGTSYQTLALEEAEAWEAVRVETIAESGRLSDAVLACRRLIERNGESKLVSRHLIRLGDLYSEAARREHRRSRSRTAAFDGARYDRFLSSAFSSYELASEDRTPFLRREAATRIDALLAYHDGVRSHAP